MVCCVVCDFDFDVWIVLCLIVCEVDGFVMSLWNIYFDCVLCVRVMVLNCVFDVGEVVFVIGECDVEVIFFVVWCVFDYVGIVFEYFELCDVEILWGVMMVECDVLFVVVVWVGGVWLIDNYLLIVFDVKGVE